MQTVFAPLPELHLLNADAESAPETRQRYFTLLEFLLQLEEFALQDTPSRDPTRLLRDPGADLAVARATVEIFDHLQRGQAFRFADHHHLALQHMPRKQQTDLRVIFNLMGFAAAKVGIKHQPFFVVML